MRPGKKCFARVLPAAAICAGIAMIAAPAAGQHGGHGAHPPMPGTDLVFHAVPLGKPADAAVEIPVKPPSAMAPAKLERSVDIPFVGSAKLLRYLPKAKLTQRVERDETGASPAAALLFISGPTQQYERWLVAGDPDRNRLTSFIATWRFMGVQSKSQRDELLEQFRTELTREPVVRVGTQDRSKWAEFPMKTGSEHVAEEVGATVRVLAFLPDYIVDRKTGKPETESDKRLNPAVLVEIFQGGKTEQRWVFAKYPDFGKAAGSQLPVRVELDCPVEAKNPMPDFAVVTTGGAPPEVWMRDDGEVTVQTWSPGLRVEIPKTQYGFELRAFHGSARMLEEYEPTDERASAALQVEIARPMGESKTVWIGMDQRRTIQVGGEVVSLYFGQKTGGSPKGGHP